MPSSPPKVWLITGCSSGFGREITLAALARGDHVIATARNADKLADLQVQGATALSLDVTSDDATLAKVVGEAFAVHGRIDILVNNAGYILEGVEEECSRDEVLAQFETNVFGVLNVTRAVLPYLRKQRSGVVANIGSVVGWVGGPGGGLYSASKFAVAGLSQSLRAETAHLGLEVVCIEPGFFRTSFLAGANVVASRRIDDYEPVTKPLREFLAQRNGTQIGDPVEGAKLIVEALTKTGRCAGRALPTRLVLGSDAIGMITDALALGQKELADWAELARSTDIVE